MSLPFGIHTFDSVILKRNKTEREVWMRKNDLALLESKRYVCCGRRKLVVCILRVTDLYVSSQSALPLPSDAPHPSILL